MQNNKEGIYIVFILVQNILSTIQPFSQCPYFNSYVHKNDALTFIKIKSVGTLYAGLFRI
jgi:hypothetical protein